MSFWCQVPQKAVPPCSLRWAPNLLMGNPGRREERQQAKVTSLENDTLEASASSGVGPIVTASCQNPTCLPLLLPMGAGAGMQSHAYLIKNNNNNSVCVCVCVCVCVRMHVSGHAGACFCRHLTNICKYVSETRDMRGNKVGSPLVLKEKHLGKMMKDKPLRLKSTSDSGSK